MPNFDNSIPDKNEKLTPRVPISSAIPPNTQSQSQSQGKSQLFSVCEVRPYLFISGYCALSAQKLRQLKITHAVDATNIPKALRVEGVDYLVVPIDDSETAKLGDYFKATADHVAKAKSSNGKALIYCAAGVSRAATLTIITLMQLEGLTLKEAYAEVVKARPLIAPNVGFWRKMIDLEKQLKGGVATVELLKGMRRPIPSVYLNKSSLLLGSGGSGGAGSQTE